MKIRRVDFYPDDWLAGTRQLDHVECGVYITICALIYATGGRIDEALLKAHSQSHGNMLNRALRRLEMLGKITRNGSEIGQKRSENELERRRKTLGKARENGAKGGRPNGLEKAAGFANQKANKQQTTIIKKDSETLTDSLLSPSDSFPKHTIGAKPAVPRRAYARDFERFWKEYPHRGGLDDPKKPAGDQFAAKVKAGADPKEIIAGAGRYAERIAEQHTELKFVPQAVKWLRQEGWKPNGHDYQVSERIPQRSKPTGPPPPLIQRVE